MPLLFLLFPLIKNIGYDRGYAQIDPVPIAVISATFDSAVSLKFVAWRVHPGLQYRALFKKRGI